MSYNAGEFEVHSYHALKQIMVCNLTVEYLGKGCRLPKALVRPTSTPRQVLWEDDSWMRHLLH